MKANATKPAALPRYVGYAEIKEAWGLDRRQIQRLRERGKFPNPVPLGTKAAAFLLDDVLAWEATRRGGISDRAVTDPNKLRDDELPVALQALAARHVAAAHGEAIEPADVVSVLVKAKPEQVAAAKQLAAEATDEFAAALAQLDVVRAWLVVAGLLPAIRTAADKFLETITGVQNTATDEQARELSLDILDQALSGEFVGPESKRPGR